MGSHSLLQGIFPTQVSCRFFTVWASRKALYLSIYFMPNICRMLRYVSFDTNIQVLKLFCSFSIERIKRKKEKESEGAQSCLTLCNPMDCSLPGSSIHGILQARILEWVAISFSRGSSQPRDRTKVSRIAGRRFILWATKEALKNQKYCFITCPRNSTKHLEKE